METRVKCGDTNKMAAEEPGARAGVVRQWIPLQRQLVPTTKDATEVYRRNVRRRQKEAIQNALSRGYLKTLDGDLILEQWQCADNEETGVPLEHVLRVSLPSSCVQAIDDMALLSCPRLRLCNLSNCFVNDMAAFYGCINLLKLDLSNNQIERVPPRDFWFSLSSLRVLYLHGNSISDRSCLQRLNHCPRLHVLTLHSTPLSLLKNYRHHVINGIMSLQALDEYVVSDEEIIENMSLQGSFQTFSLQLRLQLYLPTCKGTDFALELRGVYQLLLAMDSTLAHYSPVHIVQRWVRGWLTRRALAKSANTRIRKLLSKYSFTSRRTHNTAPPPPNTAATVHRPVPQPADIFQHVSRPNPHALHTISSDPFQPPTITPHVPSGSSFSPTLTAALPVPPPSSPVPSPHTHKGVPNRAFFSCSPQHRTSGLPVDSYTMTIDPNSSQLQHSLCVNMNQLQQSVHSPSRPTAAGRTQHSKQNGSMQSPSPGKQGKKGRHAFKNQRKVLESKGVDSMTVTGEKREVMVEENRAEKMVHTKKEDGKRLREAEEQIMETLTITREPPSKDFQKMAASTTIHGAPRLSRDALAFSRVFESMTLSTLRAVDRIHEVERARENWDRKAAHVTRMKIEREKRRLKIQDMRQKTKETIESWRIMEENKIARLQDQNSKLISQHLLDKSIQRSAACENRKRDATDRLFAAEFTQQALNVGRDVSKDDHKISTESRREEIKRQVEQLTEAARQRRDETRTEREIRDTQLMWEGVLAKKELNGKMMQGAVQRMSEVKRRVGRALNRRAAAKASVARAREALRNNAGQTTTLHSSLPPLKLDSRTEAELAQAGYETLQTATMESSSCPYRLRQFTHKANRSWQRGTIVLAERERQTVAQVTTQKALPPPSNFPKIDNTATLTYPQLRPGHILQSLVSTPFQSERTELSPATTPPSESCTCNFTTQPHPLGVT